MIVTINTAVQKQNNKSNKKKMRNKEKKTKVIEISY